MQNRLRNLISHTSDSAYVWTRRLFLSCILLEIFQLLWLSPLWLSELPRILQNTAPAYALMTVWGIAIVSSFIRKSPFYEIVINYICCVIVFGNFAEFEYHIDFVYIAMSFYFLTIEDIRRKDEMSGTVPCWVYPVGLTIGVGFFYFDSALFKIIAPMWTYGLGFWLPTSIPHVVWWPELIHMIPLGLSKVLSHATLLFEFAFIPFVWLAFLGIHQLRPIILLGALLHIGIFFAFPIPLFACGMLALYVLILPIQSLKEPPVTTTSWRIQKPAVMFFSTYILTGMLLFLSMPHDVYAGQYWQRAPISRNAYNVIGQLTGIKLHGLFVDEHFSRCPFTISVRVDESERTYTRGADEQGIGDLFSSGRDWRHRTFSTHCNILAEAAYTKELQARFRHRYGEQNVSGELLYKTYQLDYQSPISLKENQMRSMKRLGRFDYQQHRLELSLEHDAIKDLSDARHAAQSALENLKK